MRLELQGRPADRDIAWRRLGDTDFLNRAANAGAVEMALEPVVGQASRLTGTLTGPLGIKLPFVETRNGWVRHRWFRQDREFSRGPVARSSFLLSLEPDGDAVRPTITLDLEARSWLLGPVLRTVIEGYRSGWQKVVDGLPAPGAPASHALTRPLSESTEAALGRWRKTSPPQVVDAVREMLAFDRDSSLRQVRAFTVADRFGLDRMDTLSGMLRAVPAGVLEMYWSVRCPRCSGEVAAATSLSDVADHASCTSCNVSFTTDLSESVEVVFAPHPSVAPRVAERFCTMYPSGAPELFATLPIAAAQELTESVELPVGAVFHVGAGGARPDATLEVVPDGDRQVAYTVGTVEGAPPRFRVAPGALQVRLKNDTGADQRVVVAKTRDSTQVVPASLVATLPEFRRELGTEVLSRNVRVGTRAVCLLFTDLSGSTAMYEEIGDARAFALVRDHFEVLSGVIEKHRGTVVKTIGDAVMASFDTMEHGTLAALEMRDAFDRFAETRRELTVRPRLNVGVHFGPALAVHTDAMGMDWFGRTVNLAARAQSAAKDGALVLTEVVVADPAVRRALGAHEALADWVEVDLKGIGVTRLRRIRRAEPVGGVRG